MLQRTAESSSCITDTRVPREGISTRRKQILTNQEEDEVQGLGPSIANRNSHPSNSHLSSGRRTKTSYTWMHRWHAYVRRTTHTADYALVHGGLRERKKCLANVAKKQGEVGQPNAQTLERGRAARKKKKKATWGGRREEEERT